MRLIRPAAILSTVLLLAIAAGCAPARRPEQQQRPTSPPLTTPSSLEVRPPEQGTKAYPSPRAGSAYDDPSMGVSTIASAVPGSGTVEAVVLGNVALVGLASQDSRVQRKVADQILSSFPHIAEVRITTDRAVIARLRTIRQEIMVQRSIGPYLPELASLSATMRVVP